MIAEQEGQEALMGMLLFLVVKSMRRQRQESHLDQHKKKKITMIEVIEVIILPARL